MSCIKRKLIYILVVMTNDRMVCDFYYINMY